MRKIISYSVSDVEPYINWLYFFYAWKITDKSNPEHDKLYADACSMLHEMDSRYHTHAVFGLYDANSDGDDLLLNGIRIPFLRQQKSFDDGKPDLCLSDFVRPLQSGIKDKAGIFCASIDIMVETDYDKDPYKKMLAQTLADRLTEATAEKMHEEVRKNYWGYAHDENLTISDLHKERFQGIRPAVGYPSLPDTSINFILADILDIKDIGVRLTESGAMKPHASVSGFMFAHPEARYFDLGKIGDDQLRDYSRRRGVPVNMMRRFLASNLDR